MAIPISEKYLIEERNLIEKYNKGNIWYDKQVGYKKAGIDITPILTEEIIQEIAKCSQDVHYTIENYFKVKTLDKGIQPFKLYPYQKEQIDLYLKHRFVLLHYPRQSGKTVGTVAYFLWKMLFNDNFTIISLANKDIVAKGIIKKIKLMIKHLPLWLQEGIVKMNESEIEFENGSRIISLPTTEDSGRSESANILYIDEVAFIKRKIFEEFYAGAYPTISAGKSTQIIMTSTPNGLNHWWLFYKKASKVDKNGNIIKKGTSEYIVKEIQWNEVPGRDENFKKETIKNLGQRKWLAEYECQFLGSANNLISSEILEKFTPKEPIEEKKFLDKYDLKIYKKPEKDHSYFLTVDLAEGLGGDSDGTAFQVIDVSRGNFFEQVAVFYSNTITLPEVSFLLKDIAVYYNNAMIVGEVNKYPTVFYNLKVERDYEYVFINPDDGRNGIVTNKSTKKFMLSIMKKFFEQGKILIHDSETIFQLSVFVKKGDSYQADEGEHDDLVMSLALLFFIVGKKDLFEQYISENINYNKEILDIDREDEELPIIIDNGVDYQVW